MKPLKKKVLIESIPDEQLTSSGIEIVSPRTKSFLKGKVLKIGEGVEEVKLGDSVFYSASAFEEVEEWHLIHESDIFVILEE